MINHYANFSLISYETLFITCHVAQENASNICFLDSGCSNRMTINKELFENLIHQLNHKLNWVMITSM